MTAAALARTPPRVPAAGAPVSFLVDYDGTISLTDVGDELMAEHGPDAATMASGRRIYDDGRMGSRRLMEWDMDVLTARPRRAAGDGRGRPTTRASSGFVAAGARRPAPGRGGQRRLRLLRRAGNLARLGLADLPVVTTRNDLPAVGGPCRFPYGHPACFVCGTCKRERVLAHQAAGRVVVFIGDGESDRYAAFHADVVFAKRRPGAASAPTTGWPFHRWTEFAEIDAWLAAALDDGSLPRRFADVAGWRAGHPSMAARGAPGFICGPEAWGARSDASRRGPRLRRPRGVGRLALTVVFR